MSPTFFHRAVVFRNLFLTLCFGTFASGFALPVGVQSQTPTAQPNQAEAAKSAPAKSGAHHFDRVVIIVLENGDYEAAVKELGPYLLNVKVAQFENVYPMVPAGGAINGMVLGAPQPVEV